MSGEVNSNRNEISRQLYLSWIEFFKI